MGVQTRELKEEKHGMALERKKRKQTSRFVASTWLLIIAVLIAVISTSSLYVTGVFGKSYHDESIPHYDRNYIETDVFSFLIFGGVIGITINLILPYMLAISEKQNCESNEGDTAIEILSTGTHRGMSRFHSRHKTIYGGTVIN